MDMRRRWIIIALGLPGYVFILMVVGTLALCALAADDFGSFGRDVPRLILEPQWWITSSIIAGVIAGTQSLLLLPVVRFRNARLGRAKSIVLSSILLAFVAGMLVAGLVSGLSELFAPERLGPKQIGYYGSGDATSQPWFPAVFWTTLVVSWAFCCAIMIPFVNASARPENRMCWIIGMLLGGTVVEALVILPIDVMVRRRTDCYCNTGSFFALTLSIVATLWLAGPGIFIALTAKKRRAWYLTHCQTCGYAKGPSPGKRCPECGFEWGASATCAKPQAAHH
jgi:hypothetical protein